MSEDNVTVDCPSCKSKLSVKAPKAPSPSPEKSDDLAGRLAAIEARTKELPEDFCSKFPALCQDVADIKARQTESAEASEHAHYAPTEELFDHWLNCPDCKGKADKLAERLAERAKPKQEAVEVADEKPAPAPEPEAKAEPSPEPVGDDAGDSVWNRVMG